MTILMSHIVAFSLQVILICDGNVLQLNFTDYVFGKSPEIRSNWLNIGHTVVSQFTNKMTNYTTNN